MASFIVRDAVQTYIPPGAVMYLHSGGPLPKIEGDITSDEEEEEEMKEQKQQKEPRAVHGVNDPRRRSAGAVRSANDNKVSGDSAYVAFKMSNDNEDRASTTSSVPLDPSTQLPVFLNTSELEFVVAGDTPDSRKVLTLYNPYDYPFDFRILCTAPEHYEIRSLGSKVSPKHLIEITIRGKSSLMPNMVHRFKVDIMKCGRTEVIGSKQVVSRAVAYASPPRGYSEQSGEFHRIGDGSRREMRRGQMEGVNGPNVRIANEPATPFNLSMLLLLSALCLLALALPVQKDVTPTETIIPQYLHISDTQRLCAAFLMGVFTVLILQPANNR